ncbi:hypothetical protein ACW9FB_16195 [Ralstonia mannitolilytica]
MSQKFANVDDMGFAAQCLPDVNVNLPLPGGSWNLHMDMTPLCDLGNACVRLARQLGCVRVNLGVCRCGRDGHADKER